MGYLMFKDTIWCCYLMNWPHFRFWCRNLSNFSLVFWKIWKHQKDFLKLSDLYLDAITLVHRNSRYRKFVSFWVCGYRNCLTWNYYCPSLGRPACKISLYEKRGALRDLYAHNLPIFWLNGVKETCNKEWLHLCS